MQSWNDIKTRVVSACGDTLIPHGYRFIKSRSRFEKSIARGCLSVSLTLISSDAGNRFARIGCGVRNSAVEDLMGGASTADTTIGLSCDTLWQLNTPGDQESTIHGLQTYIQEVALPFLERDYSFQQLSDLLNVTDEAGLPVYRVGMGTRFWQRGLAAARLAGDRRFADLKTRYTNHVRSLSGGMYYPEYEKSVRRIEAYVA
jgi:hypothetical protein